MEDKSRISIELWQLGGGVLRGGDETFDCDSPGLVDEVRQFLGCHPSNELEHVTVRLDGEFAVAAWERVRPDVVEYARWACSRSEGHPADYVELCGPSAPVDNRPAFVRRLESECAEVEIEFGDQVRIASDDPDKLLSFIRANLDEELLPVKIRIHWESALRVWDQISAEAIPLLRSVDGICDASFTGWYLSHCDVDELLSRGLCVGRVMLKVGDMIRFVTAVDEAKEFFDSVPDDMLEAHEVLVSLSLGLGSSQLFKKIGDPVVQAAKDRLRIAGFDESNIIVRGKAVA